MQRCSGGITPCRKEQENVSLQSGVTYCDDDDEVELDEAVLDLIGSSWLSLHESTNGRRACIRGGVCLAGDY